MILVDTSIWIELLTGKSKSVPEEELAQFATCGPIVQEVLQGLRPGPASEAFRSAFLAVPVIGDPVATRTFEAAAEIYRQGRRRGITVWSSVDCLIAAIAIECGVPVRHRDRDFTAIARYTALQTI